MARATFFQRAAGSNRLRKNDHKGFVSNAPAGVPLEWLLHVAYLRWPIEQSFREEKDELGFDHFEVRSWQSIHRHLYLSQVSHLFINRMREELVTEESAETNPFFPWDRGSYGTDVSAPEPDRGSDPLRTFAMVSGPPVWPTRSPDPSARRRHLDPLPPLPQYQCQAQPHAKEAEEIVEISNRRRPNQVVFG